MNRTEISEGVRAVLRQHLNITKDTVDTTDLVRDLELDSIQQLTLVVELENLFKICFNADDEMDTRTIGDLVDLVGRHLPGANASAKAG